MMILAYIFNFYACPRGYGEARELETHHQDRWFKVERKKNEGKMKVRTLLGAEGFSHVDEQKMGNSVLLEDFIRIKST